jgi:hypothetical protein
MFGLLYELSFSRERRDNNKRYRNRSPADEMGIVVQVVAVDGERGGKGESEVRVAWLLVGLSLQISRFHPEQHQKLEYPRIECSSRSFIIVFLTLSSMF